MIKIINKADCCGCEACYNACPRSCIEMVEDEEGFLYPHVRSEFCINCGLCEKVCPIIHRHPLKGIKEQEACLLQHKDRNICHESTSGGAFTGIASYVIDQGGIVFGVEITDDFQVRHTSVETKQDLKKFRNSKYVQSRIGLVYQQIKYELQTGRMVCFSGTPCQVEGLQHYLGKDYANLVLVDIVCRAVPSPLIFKKYIEYMEHRFKAKVKLVRFRDKHYDYKWPTVKLITDNGRIYHAGLESDPWLRAYFSDVIDRPSCYSCKFKSQFRVSDFTIWDCFTPEKFSSRLDNGIGVTRVLIHSFKGKKIINQIKDQYQYIKVSPDEIIVKNSAMFKTARFSEIRAKLFKDAQSMNGIAFFTKYYPLSIGQSIKHFCRIILFKTHLNNSVKKTLYRIRRKY